MYVGVVDDVFNCYMLFYEQFMREDSLGKCCGGGGGGGGGDDEGLYYLYLFMLNSMELNELQRLVDCSFCIYGSFCRVEF